MIQRIISFFVQLNNANPAKNRFLEFPHLFIQTKFSWAGKKQMDFQKNESGLKLDSNGSLFYLLGSFFFLLRRIPGILE